MSLNDVLEEIRPGCTKRRKYSTEPSTSGIALADDDNGNELDVMPDESNTPTEPPKPRRRRKVKEHSLDSRPQAASDNLYSVSVLGDLNIEGYPLGDGEKLVIAKLIPLVVRK